MTRSLQQAIDLEEVGRPIVLATHRRSGTHLTLDLLRRHFPPCRARKRWFEGLDGLYLNLDALGPPVHLAPARARERLLRAERPLVKTHGSAGFPDWTPDVAAFARAVVARADVLAIHRDVRDVLTSFHHYELTYAPKQRTSLSHFIRQKVGGVSRPRAWAEQVRSWRAAGATSLAFEEIVGDPAAALARLSHLLDLAPTRVAPILPTALGGRWQARWRVAFTRNPRATTVPGAPGRPLRWRASLGTDDRAFIHAEAGDLLVELGYEDSDAWVDDTPERTSARE